MRLTAPILGVGLLVLGGCGGGDPVSKLTQSCVNRGAASAEMCDCVSKYVASHVSAEALNQLVAQAENPADAAKILGAMSDEDRQSARTAEVGAMMACQ